MPRKVYHGVDFDDRTAYDDVWDEEDDPYNYTYDSEQDAKEEEKYKLEEPVNKPRLWRCSVCTFDNEEFLSACDVCGVFRNPMVNVSSNGNIVDDLSKDSGASILAKSLFAPLPHWTHEINSKFWQQSDGDASKDVINFNKIGHILGNNYDLHKALGPSQNTNIVPFKFDSPSPDDLVSSRKDFLRSISKESKSTRVPSNNTEKEKAKISPNTYGLERSSEDMSTFGQHSAGESHCSSVSEDKRQNLVSNFKKVNVSEDLSKNNLKARKSTSRSHYKPETWMLTDQERMLTQLNLAIVGHVDSGKSTLTGRLLNLLGRISQKELHKNEKDAKSKGKGSFAYAWALDESAEERERGITMTVGVAYFSSKRYHVVVLDSPGHKDFVPNMISGATQADAAILVVDASIGSFEAGMNVRGQTREHAQLIRSFGVDQVILAINKMDTVKYSKQRFDSIKSILGTFLRSCGFKDSLLTWVPVSAMENQNLVTAASDIRLSSWYHGSYLLDAIDSLQPPTRDISKPLIMPICDVIKSHSSGQVAASGKVEAGALRCGMKVLVLPSGDLTTVRSLERDSKACTIVKAGDNVSVYLQGMDGTSVMAGGVLCHPDFPVAIARHLELKIIMLDGAMPILVGSQVEFHVYNVKEAARVVRIFSLLDPKTGEVSKKAPRCLTAKQSAMIEVILDEAVCVDEFSNCRVLGRVFLRASGRTIAVGIVTRIVSPLESQSHCMNPK